MVINNWCSIRQLSNVYMLFSAFIAITSAIDCIRCIDSLFYEHEHLLQNPAAKRVIAMPPRDSLPECVSDEYDNMPTMKCSHSCLRIMLIRRPTNSAMQKTPAYSYFDCGSSVVQETPSSHYNLAAFNGTAFLIDHYAASHYMNISFFSSGTNKGMMTRTSPVLHAKRAGNQENERKSRYMLFAMIGILLVVPLVILVGCIARQQFKSTKVNIDDTVSYQKSVETAIRVKNDKMMSISQDCILPDKSMVFDEQSERATTVTKENECT